MDHDLVFAREDGNPADARPRDEAVRELVVAAGLRPIRLHDLRPGAASMMLASGLDIVLVSKRLGHISISITADTYLHLLENVDREAADRTAALLAAPRRLPLVTSASPPITTRKTLVTNRRPLRRIRREP